METKKVIEQEELFDIEIRFDNQNNNYQLHQTNAMNSIDIISIEKSKAREVAKAIYPKYQELEDHNAKLLEALEKFTILNPDHYTDIAGLIKNAVQLIQQSKSKEV